MFIQKYSFFDERYQQSASSYLSRHSLMRRRISERHYKIKDLADI